MVHGSCLAAGSVAQLVELGRKLDGPAPVARQRTMGAFLAEALLRVRDRRGKQVPLKANRAQSEYERRRGQSNIVLKARQKAVT
jgi:hypothetical protein